jgi:hypothetical protein
MRMINATESEVTITISFDDLDFLRQGMREMLEALSDREIKVRTGNTSEQAAVLMKDIRDVLEAANEKD